MTKCRNQNRTFYRLIQVVFDKLEERDHRIAALEAENAELIRKLAEKLFKKDAPND